MVKLRRGTEAGDAPGWQGATASIQAVTRWFWLGLIVRRTRYGVFETYVVSGLAGPGLVRLKADTTYKRQLL